MYLPCARSVTLLFNNHALFWQMGSLLAYRSVQNAKKLPVYTTCTGFHACNIRVITAKSQGFSQDLSVNCGL